MTKSTFITQFNRVLSKTDKADCVEFLQPNKVKKSLSYAVDIKTIFDNYCKTGRVPLNGNQPIYDEGFIKYDSLIEAQKQVSEAVSYFNNLPASIRANYGNSLEKFVLALQNKDDYLVKEGVLVLPEPVLPDDTPKPSVVQPTVQPTSQTVVETPTTTA